MFNTNEIIDLIRTGYIPPDPGRLGEFGRVLEALGERRSTEPLGECEWCKVGNDPEDGMHFVEHEYRRSNERYVACTATPERIIAELRAQLAAAQTMKEDTLRVYAAIRKNASDSVALLERVGMGQQPGKGNCLIDMVKEVCGRISELEQASEARGQEESKLRELLWLRHAPGHLLYGDDGKMDCNTCMIDFKAAPSAEIEKQWFIAALATPAATPAPVCRACNGSRLAQSIQGIPDAHCPICATPAVEQADTADGGAE